MKKLFGLVYFGLLSLVDICLIHPWWDRMSEHERLDYQLYRFCQYAIVGFFMANRRKWRRSNV